MSTQLPEVLKNRLADYGNELRFWLNGREIQIQNPDPTLSLVNYLHANGLTGTKVGCDQGGCGACTVMISRRTESGMDHRSINSCLRPVVGLADCEVTTVEGIGNLHEGLDPVQHRIAVYNGSQCGFCTPGFVMNMHAYLQQHSSPTEQQIEDLFGGNLCRCTGYRPILHGMRTFACDYKPGSDATLPCALDPFFEIKMRPEAIKIDGTKLPSPENVSRLHFSGEGVHWIRPASLHEVSQIKNSLVEHAGPDQVKLVVGNTASGIYPNEKPQFIIDISHIKELTEVSENADGLHVGAAVPIQDLLEFAERLVKSKPKQQTTGLQQLVQHGKCIAGIQVRNAGSIAGNIFITKGHTRTGVPFPSDLFTVLATLGTVVTIASSTFEKNEKAFSLSAMPVAEEMPPDAILKYFSIPYTREREYVQTYRIARRPQMAHPVVNAGFRCLLDDNDVVEEITVVFGGLASCNGSLPGVENWLKGKKWDEDSLQEVWQVLRDEVQNILIPMEEEGFTNAYRSELAENFFYKFFLHVANRIDATAIGAINSSAAEQPVRPLSSGMQTFEIDDSMLPLTSPIAKRTAISQATGEVKYCHDLPLPPGGYYAEMVMSSRPHARFKFAGGLQATEERIKREFPSFIALVTVADIPPGGRNLIGLGGDDPIFSDGVVTSIGAPICLVLAEKHLTAKRVAKHVANECITYEDLPAIVSFEEAIAKKHVMPPAYGKEPDPTKKAIEVTRHGSNTEWLDDPSKPMPGQTLVTGRMRTPAQVHFYMETMCAIAYPGSYDEITIFSSTQNPNGDQGQIARALGIKANQVTIRVEQLGGGFGGKQNRAVFTGAMAAIAAKKTRRPILIKFDRETDMQNVGKRHPHISDYAVSYQDDGTISGMNLELRTDGGSTIDCSFAVIKGGVMMSDGCYRTPTMRSAGTVYQTNKTSNSAMRTFGQVQPHLLVEDAIEHVAFDLSKRTGRTVTPEEIRRHNLYHSSEYETADATHFGQPLWYCDIREQWDNLYESSQFEERLKEVRLFNSKNRWRKRGISMVPLKYGIGFKQMPALNTSTALVHINKDDGSVTVMHGGVEMGQGLHTKIAQVVAHEMNVPLGYVRVVRNNTDAIVNAPATAASTGFDLNGGAVVAACRTLKKRLDAVCDEVKRRKPELGDLRLQWREKWPLIIQHAWMQRVNLSATELYRAPHYDTPVDHYEYGKFFAYFTYSFSVSEVEIDVLTGEFSVIRSDLLYDAGKSPNPAIDIGQIEGGFVQGLGFVTTEEPIFDHEGRFVTDNIWSYKPPCSKTIPLDLRVTLVPRDTLSCFKQEQAGLLAVKASKSTCEPTLSLGNSVYFAIKHAIMAARREQTGLNEWLELPVPLSCQRIQQACCVDPAMMTMAAAKEKTLDAAPTSGS
jgi:xanthine dehydrogenase/oxidase